MTTRRITTTAHVADPVGRSSGLAASELRPDTPCGRPAAHLLGPLPKERPSGSARGRRVDSAGVVIPCYPISWLTRDGQRARPAGRCWCGALVSANAIYQRRKMRNVSVFDVSMRTAAARWCFAIPLAAPIAADVIGLGRWHGDPSGRVRQVSRTVYYYVMNTLVRARAGFTLLVPVTPCFWGVLCRELPAINLGMAVISRPVLTNLKRPGPSPPSSATRALDRLRGRACRPGRQAAIDPGPRTPSLCSHRFWTRTAPQPESFQVTGASAARAFNACCRCWNVGNAARRDRVSSGNPRPGGGPRAATAACRL